MEKWPFRLFLLYVILRVAGATWSNPSFDEALRFADWFVVAVPAGLLSYEVRRRDRSLPRTLYLVSVVTLYLSLLAAVHLSRPALILSLATASALFHATEYLALASWSVHARQAARGDGPLGLMSRVVSHWGLALGTFILVLGAGGWLFHQHLMHTWLLINVIVAFLHYAYDGLIWRRPKAHL